MDIDTIRPGFDFVDEISKAIQSADAVLVLIGDGWSMETDAAGNRRIGNDDDPVRLEVATALREEIRVIPILVGGAHMPASNDLPADLAALPRLHAVTLDPGRRFHEDVDDLIASLRSDSKTAHNQGTASRLPMRLILPAVILCGAAVLAVALWPRDEPIETDSSSVSTPAEEAPTQPTADAPNAGTGDDEATEPRPTALSLEPIPMRNNQFVNSVAFSRDSEMLATTNSNQTISLWEVATGEEMYRLRPADAIDAVFSPNGDSLATRMYGTIVTVWNTRDGSERFRFSSSEEFGFTAGLTFTPDGQRIVTANESGAVQIRNASDGDLVRQIDSGLHSTSLSVSRDGSLLAVGSGINDSEGVATVWELESGTEVAAFPHPARVTHLDFSPDGKTLAVGWGRPSSDVGGATLWNVEAGEELGVLGSGGRTLRDRLETTVVNISFSNDGRLLATQSFDGSGMVRIWNAQSLAEFARFEHSRGVSDFAFSPDDAWIATATYGGVISIWEVATASQLIRAVHELEVHAITFSSSGEFIAGDVESGVLYRIARGDAP